MNKLILFLSAIFLIGIVFASITDIKVVVCDSINLTGSDCNDWWDSLNLTDLNFTEIVVEYNTITNEYDYSNNTYYENITKTYYNNTGSSQSYLDKRYVNENDLLIELHDYALKGEAGERIINNTIIETQTISKFTWWNVGTIMNFVFILGLIVFLFFMVKELNENMGREE